MNFDNFKQSDHSVKLLKCHKCLHVTDICPEAYSDFSHCFSCACSNLGCKERWFICTKHNKRFCSSKICRMKEHFLLLDHSEDISNQNSSKKVSSNHVGTPIDKIHNAHIDCIDEILFQNQEESGHDHKRAKHQHDCHNDLFQTSFPKSFLPDHSRRYFENDMLSPGGGKCAIVSRAFRQSNGNISLANLKESNLHLNIAHFCASLSQSQQYDFASIVSSLVSKDIFEETRPPLSYTDITKFYTNSQFSIYKNIPSPNVFIFDDHACVSIESIINHMLSFNIKLNTISVGKNFNALSFRTNMIENTREVEYIMKQISDERSATMKDQPIVIYIIMWSDDFEANNVRKNRNSTWIKTITICPPSSAITSPLYTYPISLGRKGQCHDKVNHYFNDELGKLSRCTLRYSTNLRKLYPVIVRPLCVSADRPERSSLNCILSHNGSSTKRWMYSELIQRNKLPSCMKCCRSRAQRLLQSHVILKKSSICKRCCDWEMSYDNHTSYFLPPTNYPSKKHPESPPPPLGRDVSQPFEKLPPVRVTYDFLKSATKFAFWNYLHSAWNKSQTQTYFRLVGISTSYFDTIIENADQSKKYLPVSKNILDSIRFPAMWTSLFRLEQSIDTPMHLLFQGITKAIIEESKEFLKFHKSWTAFGRQCNEIMDDVNSVHIDFCKVESFNGGNDYTTGGWIAETYIGFARIICIMYSLVGELLPPLSLALNEFQCMIQCLFCMLSRLMADVDSPIDEITDYIKLFLSCCHKYHSALYDTSNSKNPFWNSPNFLSLLNLPSQIEQFGSMRLYWEGVNERYIQFIKPHLKNMRSSTTFLALKLDNIHKTNVLKHQLLDPLCKIKKYDCFKDCKKYKDVDTILQLTVMCGSLQNDKFLVVLYSNYRQCMFETTRFLSFFRIFSLIIRTSNPKRQDSCRFFC